MKAMMSRIDRIRRAISARKASKAEDARILEDFKSALENLPAPLRPVPNLFARQDERFPRDTEVEAQLLGQDGERRGLRAGPSLLDFARSAYSRIEWSGTYDRRARIGRRKRDV